MSGHATNGAVRMAWASNLHADGTMPMRSVLIDHAAEILGVSRRTIYNRIRQGQLETVRTAGGTQRVLLGSIEALLQRSSKRLTVPAAGASDTDPSEKSPAP